MLACLRSTSQEYHVQCAERRNWGAGMWREGVEPTDAKK